MQPGSGNSLTIDAEIKEKMLPLPLTPFEFLFFCDCSDAYPMNFIMQIDFSGHLDRERFESAGMSLPPAIRCCKQTLIPVVDGHVGWRRKKRPLSWTGATVGRR